MFSSNLKLWFIFKYTGYITSCYNHHSRGALGYGVDLSNTLLKIGRPIFNSSAYFVGVLLFFKSFNSYVFSSNYNAFFIDYSIYTFLPSYVIFCNNVFFLNNKWQVF